MDESEEAKLRAAEQLRRSRNIIDAVAMYFDLLQHGKDPQARLTAAIVLLDRLKFTKAPEMRQTGFRREDPGTVHGEKGKVPGHP